MLGIDGIPELRLSTLTKLITKFTVPPNLLLMTLFGSDRWPSDMIEWETQTGNRGLAPFVARGSQAPILGLEGYGAGKASAAYFAEKMFFDEAFLNNLRQPGTPQTKMSGKKKIANELSKLVNRSNRRKEWMFAQMLTVGTITYKKPSGMKVYVDYAIPSANQVDLGASRYWDDGENRNIVEDIMDANITMSNANGSKLSVAMFTSEILKLMVLDTGIQTLLQKSAFGKGDLFANPTGVLGTLLGFDKFILYDEQYQARAFITSAVTGASTVDVYVDDASDFVAGGTLTFHDKSASTTEAETISSVTEQSSYVTVSAAPTASFKANEDYVTMTKKFLPITKFCMFTPTVDGENIAEYAMAPFGLDEHYGQKPDRWEVKDPDGAYVRVENLGLPILYHEDAPYILTVKD